MTRTLIDNNFLLGNRRAEELFHGYAKDLPVIDIHNHLNPYSIKENAYFENVAQLWVIEDPYKHRAMRMCGIPEESITGQISDKQKFLNWARIVPKTIGNPLFHWTCLELKRIFGIDEILSENNAEEIWNLCNNTLCGGGFGTNDILEKWNIDFLCTSDSPTDSLAPHRELSASGRSPRLFPSMRCDSLLAFDAPDFIAWILKLSVQIGQPINSLEDYLSAIIYRLDYFNESGCFLSDHSLDSGFLFDLPSPDVAAKLFKQILEKDLPASQELIQLKSFLLKFLGEEYSKRGWIMQLHIGAHRNTSSRLRKLAGSAGGYACIGKCCNVESLTHFMDVLEQNGQLPKVILYTLNPSDNEILTSLTGSYAQDGVPGKIRVGSSWWYNDHYDGICNQLTTISNYGLLSQFIGMTTDSRSALSFSRHEYFRRILCNVLGSWVEQGRLPDDLTLIGQIVKDISYYNIKNWISNK